MRIDRARVLVIAVVIATAGYLAWTSSSNDGHAALLAQWSPEAHRQLIQVVTGSYTEPNRPSTIGYERTVSHDV